MTSIANPDYQYYKKLEGTWKDANGSCEAVLNSAAGIEIRYASGKLASSYGVTALYMRAKRRYAECRRPGMATESFTWR